MQEHGNEILHHQQNKASQIAHSSFPRFCVGMPSKHMGRSRYKFGKVNASHFMACTAQQWISVFTRPETVNIVLDSFRYLMSEAIQLYAYIVLENHLQVMK